MLLLLLLSLDYNILIYQGSLKSPTCNQIPESCTISFTQCVMHAPLCDKHSLIIYNHVTDKQDQGQMDLSNLLFHLTLLPHTLCVRNIDYCTFVMEA